MSNLNYEYPLDRDPKYLAFGFGDTLHYKESDMEDILDKHQKFMISSTWKERHAKGVPVKMDWIRFAKCCAETQAVNGVVRGLQFGEDPKAWSGAHGGGVFCNFRYKQSWLDKNSISVIPSCKYSGPCIFPECGADPEEGPYACEARPQKGGEHA